MVIVYATNNGRYFKGLHDITVFSLVAVYFSLIFDNGPSLTYLYISL